MFSAVLSMLSVNCHVSFIIVRISLCLFDGTHDDYSGSVCVTLTYLDCTCDKGVRVLLDLTRAFQASEHVYENACVDVVNWVTPIVALALSQLD